MKKFMFLVLVLGICAMASADIATITVVRDSSGATSTVARMLYTGGQVDYDYPNSWMQIGDHINGANHYSDGMSKYDLPAVILPSYTINSVTLQGTFNGAGDWDDTGKQYVRLEKYNFDNSTIPILLADAPDNANTSYVTTLELSGYATNYVLGDAALTAAVAADIAAGYDFTGLTWQMSDPSGNAIANHGEFSIPELNDAVYATGFASWVSHEMVIDYTIPEPATMALLALGSAVLLKRKK